MWDKEKKKEYGKQYYILHKEECKANRREYYLTHKEETKVSRQRYFALHKKESNERRRKWYAENPKKSKLYMQKRHSLERAAGDLSLEKIQMVYEDNIKKYGTLTCIYCLNPIQFSDDALEHKQPITRGGTNEYENLGVACHSCNSKKCNRTESEFRECLIGRNKVISRNPISNQELQINTTTELIKKINEMPKQTRQEYNKNYYETHKEQRKEYLIKTKEERLKKRKNYYEIHKEQARNYYKLTKNKNESV